nr:unnamed protein product [Callosobruchus analis]
MPQLKAHPQKFYEYFRMELQTLDYVLNKIEQRLRRDWCNFHKNRISPEERLMVTLKLCFIICSLT